MPNETPPQAPRKASRANHSASYISLFGWPESVQPGELNDNTLPLAYLTELHELLSRLENGKSTSGDVDEKAFRILLQERRPDIPRMPMDDSSLKRTFPALRRVIDILEDRVREVGVEVPTSRALTTDGSDEAAKRLLRLHENIATASFPASLPFHFSWERIKAVLQQRKLTAWDAVRKSDYNYPNFTFSNRSSASLHAATTMASGLSPELRQLLTADDSTVAATIATLREHASRLPFAAADEPDLTHTDTLRRVLGLSRKQLRQCLAVYRPALAGEDRAPPSAVVRSPFAETTTEPSSNADFGAAFIHNGTTPLYLCNATAEGSGDASGDITIVGATDAHLDRMIRIIRLHHAMKLPFPDIDLLVVTALRAEGHRTDFKMTPTTMRAMGMFQHLREQYGVTANQFAAFIGSIAVCATGRETPFYDTLFNPRGILDRQDAEPVLTMDGMEFSIEAEDVDSAVTVSQLSQAFGADETTVRWALECVIEAQDITKPKRTLDVVSACYRLIALPRAVGLNTEEITPFLSALNKENPEVFSQLAGTPSLAPEPETQTTSGGAIDTDDAEGNDSDEGAFDFSTWLFGAWNREPATASDSADVLNVIALVMNAAEWFKQHRLPIAALCRCLLIPEPTKPSARWIEATRLVITAQRAAVKGSADGEDGTKVATKTDLVSSAIRHALQLIDPSLALPLLHWINSDATTFIAAIDALEQRVIASAAKTALPTPTTEATRTTVTIDVNALAAAFGPDDLRMWTELERRSAVMQLLRLSPNGLKAMTEQPDWFNLEGLSSAMRPLDFTTLYQVTRYGDWLATLQEGVEEHQAIDYLREAKTNRTLTPEKSAATLAKLTGWRSKDIELIALAIAPKTVAGTAEDLRDIDYLMRMHELSARTGMSIDALQGLNKLKFTQDHSLFEMVATRMMAACNDDEVLEIEGRHGELWRDALVAWLLAHWVPTQPRLAHITDVDSLSDHLLTDVRVGREPNTSLVASAMASLQTGIHRILSGLETGHEHNAEITGKLKALWSGTLGEYSRWKMLKQLRNHPENHVDPSRRARKTALFADLENLLSQGKLSAVDVQTAILGYLAGFEANSNIQPLTAYHDGTDPTQDTFHFIGKSNVSPPTYYWRTLNMSVRDASNAPSMLAWSEWEPVTLPLSGAITQTPVPSAADVDATQLPKLTKEAIKEDPRTHIDTIRPVVIDTRRYIFWVERDTTGLPVGKGGATSLFFALRVCFCYQQIDGLWGPSNVLLEINGRNDQGVLLGETEKDSGIVAPESTKGTCDANIQLKTLEFSPAMLVMVNAEGARKHDPWLTVLLYQVGDAPSARLRNNNYYFISRDTLLLRDRSLDDVVETPGGPSPDRPIEDKLLKDWKEHFRDPRVVQHRYIGNAVEMVEADQPLNAYSVRDEGAAADIATRFDLGGGGLGEGKLTAKMRDDDEFIELVAGYQGAWSIPETTEVGESYSCTITDGAAENAGPLCSFDLKKVVKEESGAATRSISYELDAKWLKDISRDKSDFDLCASITCRSEKTGHMITLCSYVIWSSKEEQRKRALVGGYASTHSRGTVKPVLFTTRRGSLISIIPKSDLPYPGPEDLSDEQLNEDFKEMRLYLTRRIHTFQEDRGPERMPELRGDVDLKKNSKKSISTTRKPFGSAHLVLRGGTPSDGVKVTLSTEDNYVLQKLGLADLPAAIEAKPTAFAPIRAQLARDPLMDYDEFGARIGVSSYYWTHDKKPVSWLIRRAKDWARYDVVDEYVAKEAACFATNGVTVPSGIDIVKLVALKHAHRDTFARLMVSTQVGNAVLAETTVVLDGTDHSRAITARFPVSKATNPHTFKLEVYADDDTEMLGSITRQYNLQEQGRAKGAHGADAVDDAVASARLIQNRYQVHYLDLTEVAGRASNKSYALPTHAYAIRLNTLLGMRFAALATNSPQDLLDWKTQQLPAPRMAPGTEDGTVDFHGANGFYFWELFMHLPMLVAWKLRSTRQYRESLEWCTRHLFDPYDAAGNLDMLMPPFWHSRPLTMPNAALKLEANTLTTDIETFAYAEPERYRKAMLMFVVELWRQQGDDFYRQLTRDGVAEAGNHYRRALALLGPLPERLTTATPSLPTLTETRASHFLPPVNTVLTQTRDLLESRMFNLRHGLTIDGKIMQLDLYGAADEFDLIGSQRTGMRSGEARRGRINVPPYRFKHVLPMAKEAVQQLIDMGRQLFHTYEEEYNAGLGVLQQRNLINLSDFTLRTQREALKHVRAVRATMVTSKVALQKRHDYYQGLYEELVLPEERISMLLGAGAAVSKIYAIPFMVSGKCLDTTPNIFGMSVGGCRIGAPAEGVAAGILGMGDAADAIKDELRYFADIRYRAKEWDFEAEQAKQELEIINSQLAEQDILIRSGELAVAEVLAQQAVMKEEYTFMTTGFAIGPTYVWMIAHLSDIYASAYDAVMSLCLAAQDGWRYETGDFNREFVRRDAWMDDWRGMLAGDALQRDLLEMEAAYLRGRERRMHIRKSFSLVDIKKVDAGTLGSTIERTGEITFALPSELYDADFPGHYLRQIVNVSLSIKLATSSEVKSIAAVLIQTRNDVLFEPAIEGARYIYDNSKPEHDSVRTNLRREQKVAVSTTKPIVDIDGYSGLFSLLFGDDRYLPFEGTGAISNWTLSFPGDREELLGILKRDDTWLLEDILLTVDYTADDGGTDFADAVRALRKSDVTPPAEPSRDPDADLVSDEPRPLTFAAPRVTVGKVVGIYVAIAPQPRLPVNSAVIVSYKMADESIVDMPAQAWKGKGVSIPIEPAMIASHAGESIEVSYKVIGDEPTTSPSTPVKLPTAAQLNLLSYPRPRVTPDLVNNALDRRDAPDGAIITVEPWPYIQKGQAIWMRCLGTKADGSPKDLPLRMPPEVITEQEVKDGVRVTIPLSYLDELGDFAQLRIALKVGLSAGDSEADAETFPGLMFDLPRCSTLRVQMDVVSALLTCNPDPLLSCDYAYVATSAGEGPTSLSLKGTAKLLNVPVVDTNGKERTSRCRLFRRVIAAKGYPVYTAWDQPLDAPGRDHTSSTSLRAVISAEDNVDLPFGTYRGKTTVQLMGWQVPRVRESIRLEVDATYAAPTTPLAPTPTPKPAPSPAPVPTPKPDASKPVSGTTPPYVAPTIEFEDGTVYVTIPGNQGFIEGDLGYVAVTDELTKKRVIYDTWRRIPQDGSRFTSWPGRLKSYAGMLPGNIALVTYVVKRGDVETMSAALRIKLTPSDNDPTLIIPVVVP
jgi:hypothetical protein